MRPKSIIWFERLIFGTLLLGLIQSYLGWNDAVSLMSKAGSSANTVLIIQILVFLLMVTLTLLVSRRRSKIAMWISIALFVLGLPAFVALLANGLVLGFGLISIAQAIGQLIAFALLFTPASRSWMNRQEQLGEVFS